MTKKRRKRLPQGEFEAEIEAISHDGKGICRLDGKVHFIFGALPSERVLFEYVKIRAKFAEGRCTSVLESSDMRQSPPCAYFGTCGGCSLQHLRHQAQIKLKQDTLLEQIRFFGKLEPQEVLEPITGSHLHYRRSCRLGARYVPKKGGLLMGFRERYSHYIQEMDSCAVLTRDLSSMIPILKDTMGATSISRKIPQVEACDVENGLFIIIRHLAPFSQHDLTILSDIVSKAERNLFIFLQPKGPDSIRPLHGLTFPAPYYELREQGLRLEFSPGDFIQINALINEKLVKCAIDLLDLEQGDVLWDLFCGIGNFTLPAAQMAKQVVGVELDGRMVERAINNAILNALDNVCFYAMDLYEKEKGLTGIRPVPNKILLDPPRSGAQEVCRLMCRDLRPERIVYVSCNLATFSRDAGILVKGGYKLKKVRVVDMFPHTSHAETIGLFEL